MLSGITFRIATPSKILQTERVNKVVLPAYNGTVTILPKRAPSLFVLDCGLVKVLDENNKTLETFFVSGGVADVAKDRCAISAEIAINAYDYDLQSAQKELAKQALSTAEKRFYEMIITYYQTNKK
jgi:F-type H+-transporting ATPase subunit epsilon